MALVVLETPISIQGLPSFMSIYAYYISSGFVLSTNYVNCGVYSQALNQLSYNKKVIIFQILYNKILTPSVLCLKFPSLFHCRPKP